MGELTAAVGALGHREPEVYSTLLKVRHGSEVREMRSVSWQWHRVLLRSREACAFP